MGQIARESMGYNSGLRKNVRQKVLDAKETVHFGSLRPLYHEKNAELKLPGDEKTYKGRVIFRGDIVRDETGYYAVFSEQGTSASHLAAAKFVDAIARAPG